HLKEDLKPNHHNDIQSNVATDDFSNSIKKVGLICNKFHRITRQMRSRYGKRPTLEVNDEYDVQDLFHCLLTLYFDDIK
ncbi:MAG: hypothetical protein AAFV28_15450, partial [Cyanobacteria bacterium J06635_13]